LTALTLLVIDSVGASVSSSTLLVTLLLFPAGSMVVTVTGLVLSVIGV
jgi:hypothetical protein